MKLLFELRPSYGRQRYDPANQAAEALCTVAERECLSCAALAALRIAGFEILIEPSEGRRPEGWSEAKSVTKIRKAGKLLVLAGLLSVAACSSGMRDGAAAPRRNLVLNGSFRFDSRGGSPYLAPAASEDYVFDQWRICGMADGAWSFARVPSAHPEFAYAARAEVLRSRSAVTNTDNHHIEYPIEGNLLAGLGLGTATAQPLSLSFWVRASQPGTYAVALMEGRNSRSVVHNYAVSAPGAWQRVVLKVPADAAGSWQTTSYTYGMKIIWPLGVGADFSIGNVGLWEPIPRWSTPDSVQLLDLPAGSFMEITGVQLEAGAQATGYDHRAESEEASQLALSHVR